MRKKILLLALTFTLVWPTLLWAIDFPKVIVFPFNIFSQEPLDHLSLDLQKILISKLKSDKVEVIDHEILSHNLKIIGLKDKLLNLTLMCNLANKLEANFIISSSLTKIKNQVSLDLKITKILNTQCQQPYSIFVENSGIDNLLPLVEQVVQEIETYLSGHEQVIDIWIKNNRRIEAEAIKAVLKTKPGKPYSPLNLDADLRAIWNMGFFDNVYIETNDVPSGKIIIITVEEKFIIREIRIIGSKAIDDSELRDQISIKLFDVFRPEALLEVNKKIVKIYHDKGFYDAKVNVYAESLETNDKCILIKIEEGSKVFIEDIEFIGNVAIKSDELKEQMTIKGKGWFSWLTESNVLERSKLDQDIEKLADYYYNQGYLSSRVAEQEIRRELNGLIVVIAIQEGHRFKISNVAISGDIINLQEELINSLKTRPNEWFSRDFLREDIANITTIYADQGFAYVEVRPQIEQNVENNTISISFNIKKGEKIYFDQITITGNTNTRDKVIRREFNVAEGDLFSGTAIREANSRLVRSNFFEDVHITTNKGRTPDRMNLNIDVKEKRTGQLSLGAGYSTADHFMVIGRIGENNLFGRGQQLELKGQVGGFSNRYTISFTEPWFLDKPVSAGIDFYDWDREYYSYSKEAIGSRLRFSFPMPLRYTRLYTYYTYEVGNVYDILSNAAAIIKDQEGEHTTSSVRIILRRDSRDHFFNPTKGNDNSISIEYAGDPIGGSNAFIKIWGDTGWYIPLWLQHVFVVHSRIGWLTNHSGGNLPIYEKFFLGGINTLRGFDYQSVSPRDIASNDRIGGERVALANIEYRFPVLVKAGLIGVIFYDIGNSWIENDGYQFNNLRSSIGGGIRWLSPVGPLRLEYGCVLDPNPDESESNWEFTIGSVF